MELMAAPDQKSREVRREALLCCQGDPAGPWAASQANRLKRYEFKIHMKKKNRYKQDINNMKIR